MTAEEYDRVKQSPGYPPCTNIIPNLSFIRDRGVARFMVQQRVRMRLLRAMISQFDDGRSKSCFCRAAALQELSTLRHSFEEAKRRVKADRVKKTDAKRRAAILRAMLRGIPAAQS
jgi:hypothetical protein